ncbi:MAG: DUF2997 domain-containing protein [Verrucomicrobia bacterium]|nr:DUF2997 domain-containing protein [Verrucomicrobiota bacterium]
MKIIEILINPQGQLTINAAGFQGADCEQATAFLESALGQPSNRTRKPEWFRKNVRAVNQKVGT